jgi:uncharacterized protein (DUF488 family)
MRNEIYTVGHSVHTIEKFVGILQSYEITAVADVRSTPYSRRNPQFNREDLKTALKSVAIQYVFLGKELGARSEDQCCYVDDQVQYTLLAKTPLFHLVSKRLLEGVRSHKIALMCAEKDPLDCHRTILVARPLAETGLKIMHILSDGGVESHDAALERLVDRLKFGAEDLFRSRSISVEEAYEKQAQRIAYQRTAIQRPGIHSAFNETEFQ